MNRPTGHESQFSLSQSPWIPDPSTCSSIRQMLGAGPLGTASNHQEHADQRSCSTFHEPICSPCSLDSVGLGALQLLPLFTYDPPFASIFMFFACKCQTFILPSNQRGEGGVGLDEWWQRVWMPGSHFRWKVEWWVIAHAVIIPLSTCPLLALSLIRSQ